MGIKEALAQYCDTQQEIKGIKSRIETLERQIAVMEKQGYTQRDSVTGGEGGKRHYKIEGQMHLKRTTQSMKENASYMPLAAVEGQKVKIVGTDQ